MALIDDVLRGVAEAPTSELALDRLFQNLGREVVFPMHVQELRQLLADPVTRSRIIQSLLREMPSEPPENVPAAPDTPPVE